MLKAKDKQMKFIYIHIGLVEIFIRRINAGHMDVVTFSPSQF